MKAPISLHTNDFLVILTRDSRPNRTHLCHIRDVETYLCISM